MSAQHAQCRILIRHPHREVRDGVEIRRLPLPSFGKDSIKVRLLAPILFLLQAMFRGMFIPGLRGLMVSTSPPACGIGGAIVSLVRRVPIKFWVMDLNPDQLVVMKLVRPKSFPVRLFDAINLAIPYQRPRQATTGPNLARPPSPRRCHPSDLARCAT